MSAPRQLDQAAAARGAVDDDVRPKDRGQTHIPYRVGEREQIIGSRFRLLLDGESDHFPTARGREGLRMLLAQVDVAQPGWRADQGPPWSLGVGARSASR